MPSSIPLQPTDAARLSGGRGLLVLERYWAGSHAPWGRQTNIRIRHVSEHALWSSTSSETSIEPRLLLELNAYEHEADNFEGLAIHETGAGGARVWLISDNNFNSNNQRTHVRTSSNASRH